MSEDDRQREHAILMQMQRESYVADTVARAKRETAAKRAELDGLRRILEAKNG